MSWERTTKRPDAAGKEAARCYVPAVMSVMPPITKKVGSDSITVGWHCVGVDRSGREEAWDRRGKEPDRDNTVPVRTNTVPVWFST